MKKFAEATERSGCVDEFWIYLCKCSIVYE